MITCSIHSTEVASTHTAVEFAYRLLTDDTPVHGRSSTTRSSSWCRRSIPTGMDIVTQWYRKTLGTPYEGTAPPELYHKYVGPRQQPRLVHLLAGRDAAAWRSCTTSGTRRSSTTCTSRAPTRRACSCRRGSTRSSRTSIRSSRRDAT